MTASELNHRCLSDGSPATSSFRTSLSSRSGITCAETVVAIFCTVVLLALGVLFLQGSYNTSRRMRCERTMQKISIGLKNYVEVSEVFPVGTVGSRKLRPEQRWSWLVGVSASIFREGHAIYDKQKGWEEADLGRAQEVKGRLIHLVDIKYEIGPRLICPEMSIDARSHEPPWTNYVGVAGLGEKIAAAPITQRQIGVFGYDRQLTVAQIIDGQQTVLMLIETKKDNGPWVAGGSATLRGLLPDLEQLGPSAQFGGLHIGGAVAAFADGRVQFMNENVDKQVFQKLVCVDDERPIKFEISKP